MRPRGRPKGTSNGKRFTDGWEMKTWKPIHENIALAHVAGMKGTDIAREYGITPMLVSLVLSSAKGKTRVCELMVKYKDAMEGRHKDRMQRLQDTAMKNAERLLTSDIHAQEKPFQMFDRSIRFLQLTGGLPGDNVKEKDKEGSVTNNTINILTHPDIAPRILNGLAKLREIEALHGNVLTDTTIGGREITQPTVKVGRG
jgi:predicted transcriptional regulator